MKRGILALALALAAIGLIAARPSLSDLQAQIDALSDALAGVGAVEIVVASTAADSTTLKNATATCPAGKVVLGGGFRFTYPPGSGGNAQVIHNSYPSTASSWHAFASAPPTAPPWVLSAYAICGAF